MKFDGFEVHEQSGELTRNGARIKLQDLPFRMLVELVRRPGAVVSREELRSALWGADTFVDAEAGLNTAAAKLREALGDTTGSPQYIETIPKRGYRFVGVLDSSTPSDPSVVTAGKRPERLPLIVLVVAGLAVLVLGVFAYSNSWFGGDGRVSIAVVRFHNETGDSRYDALANSLTDAVVVSLARNPRYAVIGNSSLLRTERIFADVQKIGAALDATFVVLGQLQIGDKGLIGRAHFIRAADNRHLWASPVELHEAGQSLEASMTRAINEGVAVGLSRQ
jgi:DNA-binding winged helix-turn-helix (wHTH) protein/TolB-like protein